MHTSAPFAACCLSIAVTLIGASIMARSHRRIVARADGRAIGGPAVVCGVTIAIVAAAKIPFLQAMLNIELL